MGLNSAQIQAEAQRMGITLSDAEVQKILEQAWDQSQFGADPGKVRTLLSSKAGAPSGEIKPADQVIQDTLRELEKFVDDFNQKFQEFDEQNPFSFDEALARSSAEERFSPFYDAELSDFVSGISRQRESTQGEQKLLQTLNQIGMGQDKRNLDEAIKASEEGFAGAGLFFSGARERATGQKNIAGAEQREGRAERFGFAQEQGRRQLEDISGREATGRRQLGAERTTTLQTDIEKQKTEALARREQERAQFVGFPYYGQNVQGGLNELLTKGFQV
jgi:hypothetical protein